MATYCNFAYGWKHINILKYQNGEHISGRFKKATILLKK